jgi:hypothetical protein
MTSSPYAWQDKERWPEITDRLLASYPMRMEDLVIRCRDAFNGVFATVVGPLRTPLAEVNLSGGARGGIIGGLFEHLFTQEVILNETGWRVGTQNKEPDLFYIADPVYSLELKTSSMNNTIWGASSKVHKTAGAVRKDGSGFYLVVNYDHTPKPLITLIRFGWLDDTDWQGSKSAASASSRVIQAHAKLKLRVLFKGPKADAQHSSRNHIRHRDYWTSMSPAATPG